MEDGSAGIYVLKIHCSYHFNDGKAMKASVQTM
jgi:hypothetical protein